MTQHHDVVLARLIFAGDKRSAENRVYFEDLKVFRRHLATPQLDRFTGARKVATPPVNGVMYSKTLFWFFQSR